MNNAADYIEIRGERVVLRDPRPEDVEARLRWITVETTWQDWDAPWEGKSIVPPEKVDDTRRTMLENIAKPLPTPRSLLYIQLIGGPLLGRVSHYHHNAVNRCTMAGIRIWESAFWNQGLGTEAMGLWVDYLFSNLDLHRIGLQTWSRNHRMIRCAEKCGFVLEARLRENIEWNGQRYDGVEFGMLRREWEAMRGGENRADGTMR